MSLAIEQEIRELAARHLSNLQRKISDRIEEMREDDTSHFLIYRVLGVSSGEGQLIDVYQNKGRFLYNTAGRFVEEGTKLCFRAKYPDSGSMRIPNTREVDREIRD